MRRNLFGLSLAAFLIVGWLAPHAVAQTKTATGTITAMVGDSITVKSGDREMKFTVDAKTVLTASGAGTAERQAASGAKPAPRLTDFLKTGDAVEVNYSEAGGSMRASNIRRVASAGAGGGATSEARAETANGTVESITGTTLSITGAGGGGSSFKQSFTVDASTKIIALGAGTAASGKGGQVVLTDFVGVGDQVTVSYTKTGATLHANEVRVRARKK